MEQEQKKVDTPDTHGAEGQGWYGFDLDGTLAVYDGWRGIDHIGEPIKPMCDLIRKMHDSGEAVKIVTARIAPRQNEDGTFGEQGIILKNEQGVDQHYEASYFIRKWCEANLGFVPEIVYQKDHLMITLYDDRVKQVIPNKGVVLEEHYGRVVHAFRDMNSYCDRLALKLLRRDNKFMMGFLVAMMLYMLVEVGYFTYKHFTRTPREQKLEALHSAVHDLMLEDWSVAE